VEDLKVFRFNEYIDIKPQGSITLGFGYATYVVPDLFGNGQDYVLGCPEIVVRLNRNIDFRIEFPTTERVTWVPCKGGIVTDAAGNQVRIEGCGTKVSDKARFCTSCGAPLNPTQEVLARKPVYDPHYFSGNQETRFAYTTLMFNQPEIQVAMEHSLQRVEQMKLAAQAQVAPTPAVPAVASQPVLNAGAASALDALRARNAERNAA
jgi:hypothetical protein